MKKFLFYVGFLLPVIGYAQNSNVQLLNRGKLYVGASSSNKAALFIKGDLKAEQDATFNQAGRTVLTGDFYNNVSTGEVMKPDQNGSFEFRGDKVQHIWGTADKQTSFINFPDLIINNQALVNNEQTDMAAVIIDPDMGLSTKDLYMERGRLILDSDIIDTKKSNIAHLLVDGEVHYPADNEDRSKHEKAIIQVNLDLGDIYKEGRLIGFTPPFKKIYSDYFFYNFITCPTNKGLFGDNGKLITNPKTHLQGGKGYIVGLNIIPEGDPYYTEEWDSNWAGAKFEDRFTEKLSFARDFAPQSFTQFIAQDGLIVDAFRGEDIQVDDVTVKLEDGWNFIGNPYTTPIDMTSYLNGTDEDEWGVSRGGYGSSADVEDKYYIISQGKGTYNPKDIYSPFKFNVTYLVGQKIGGTIVQEGSNNPYIAPMQLFAIRKNTSSTKESITIPKSIRTHGESGFLLRSQPQDVYNELLIETEDTKTGGYDRLCLVFRGDDELKEMSGYNAAKFFNTSGGVNQIYTTTSDNKKMTTNVISSLTEKINMYFQPAKEEQEIVLSAYRIASLMDINTVLLEDKQTGTKVNLTKEPKYSFLSSPDDKHDRFVLHFSSATNISDQIGSEVDVYYSQGTINIENLEDRDLNSIVSLYDVSGVLILQENINEVPVTKLPVYLNKGTYIVKLAGKRNLVEKIFIK